ncbi:MAG TPA: SDR family NAD(P)-dependent oxidoreductase [Vulgatibacter sp.]|nr:SDR family NAD(P)-dependent oxidoreductase [Vulgatibacter sp.]
MARSLRGKVAIVTGASSGVGWECARYLAKAGVKLCVTARRKEALELLRAELERQGAECLVVPGDVSVQRDVENVVSRCLSHYGRIDILVNDAGVQVYAPFEQLEWEEITRVFDVTCFGYFRFARAVLPHFRAQGSGHIINVLSMLSRGGAPLLSAYASAKHALWGWAQSLQTELTGSGIDLSNVFVPSVATPMFDHAPTKLGMAPMPIPPTYHPRIIGKAVLRCARKPNPALVPVFLQGSLILWLQHNAPWVGNALLGRWGARLQMRPMPVAKGQNNLFEPVARGVGPTGSVPPTPRWKRWGATAALFAGVGAGVGAAGLGVWSIVTVRRTTPS